MGQCCFKSCLLAAHGNRGLGHTARHVAAVARRQCVDESDHRERRRRNRNTDRHHVGRGGCRHPARAVDHAQPDQPADGGQRAECRDPNRRPVARHGAFVLCVFDGEIVQIERRVFGLLVRFPVRPQTDHLRYPVHE